MVIKHAAAILAALFVILGIPALFYADVASFSGEDGISGASLEVPEQPSGQFVVLLNREKHPDTAEAWAAFFLEEPVDVIMEDVSCMTVKGDGAGQQLAERYRARLAENQMSLRREDPVLVLSRVSNGLFDAVVLSSEMADIHRFPSVYDRDDVEVIELHDGIPSGDLMSSDQQSGGQLT